MQVDGKSILECDFDVVRRVTCR